MNKSMKPGVAAQRPLTEEDRKKEMTRAFLQKRASLAEGILFNLCQKMRITQILTKTAGILLVDRSIEIADYLMEKLYGAKTQEEKPKEE